MDAKRLWCEVCNKMVEAGIEDGASAVVPLLVGTAGGAIGKAKGHWGHALVGAAVGAGIGVIVQALITKAQRLMCGECGTSLV